MTTAGKPRNDDDLTAAMRSIASALGSLEALGMKIEKSAEIIARSIDGLTNAIRNHA